MGERSFFAKQRRVLVPITHGDENIVNPKALQIRVLHFSRHAKTTGHPGSRRLYHSLRRSLYCSFLYVERCATARNSATCAKIRALLRRHSKPIKMFLALNPLKFAAIDTVSDLVKTPRRH